MTTMETRKREEAADFAAQHEDEFEVSLPPHVLTDKEQTKVVPCVECHRACVVTTFLQPAKCRCKGCKSDGARTKVVGGATAVQAGRTAPEFAAHLPDALINKEFMAVAICPFGGMDHHVVLKDIGHSPNYGPRQLLGYKDGIPQYKQETGEVATFQCTNCNTVISYSTQNPRQLRACNEPKQIIHEGPSAMEKILGAEGMAT